MTFGVMMSVLTSFLLALSGRTSAATTYIVGGSSGGWTFQIANPTFYDDQFKGTNVVVGDSLLFPFRNLIHSVYEVSQADHNSCSTANPIATHTQTNATVLLTTAGYHGFICGMPGHCALGMRLKIQVSASHPNSTVPAPPSSPSSDPSSKVPPPSSPSSDPSSTTPPASPSSDPSSTTPPASSHGNAALSPWSRLLGTSGSLLVGFAALVL